MAAPGTIGRNGSRTIGNGGAPNASRGDSYKWIALSNCTLAVLLATLDLSITLIAMPDIFRGIHSIPWCPPTASTCCG